MFQLFFSSPNSSLIIVVPLIAPYHVLHKALYKFVSLYWHGWSDRLERTR